MIIYHTGQGKFFTLEEDDSESGIKRVPYEPELSPKPPGPLDDLFFDYLNDKLSKYPCLSWDEEELALREAGYDLDLSHYATEKCPRLPFTHFIHLKENWIL